MLQHLTNIDGFIRDCSRIVKPDGTLVLMTLNRRTCLQLFRSLAPRFNPESGNDTLDLHRFTVGELTRQITYAMPRSRVQVDPVFIFPGSLRRIESLFVNNPVLGRLGLPLAVSFALTVHRNNEPTARS